MKILVTGANGLLGRCVARSLTPAHAIVAASHSRAEPGQIALDITDREAVDRAVSANAITHIVNCAGFRSPEYCLAHPEEAFRTNALAVEYLAQAADRARALFCQISTDYVFPGTHPPYREDDAPLPVNLYGRTKLAGEFAARMAKRHLILRIPALYRADLSDPRNAATEIAGWLRAGETRSQDAVLVRYFTLADEVADAVRFALERDVTGLLHVSAEQKTTKADFARRIATALGSNPAQVRDGPPPAHEDRRPHDSHLDASLYLRLGGKPFTDIDTALRKITD